MNAIKVAFFLCASFIGFPAPTSCLPLTASFEDISSLNATTSNNITTLTVGPDEGWQCNKLGRTVTFHNYATSKPIFKPFAKKFLDTEVYGAYAALHEQFEYRWYVADKGLIFRIRDTRGSTPLHGVGGNITVVSRSDEIARDGRGSNGNLDDYTVLAAVLCTSAWIDLWPYSYKGGVPDTQFSVAVPDRPAEGIEASGSFGREQF